MSSHGHGSNLHGGAAAGAGAAGAGAAEHEHVTRHVDVGLAVFSKPIEHVEHAAWWQAIPVGGSVTMSLVALVAIVCLTLIVASALARTVAVRCSR